MIVRSVDVRNLDNFDFANDAMDTIRWLRVDRRPDDADILEHAHTQWRYERRKEVRELCEKSEPSALTWRRGK